jgi:hypothetical protein
MIKKSGWGKECPAGCEKVGNCNIEEGRCECPYGRTGPACEKEMFPSCKHNAQASDMFCAEGGLVSCECARQCWSHYCGAGSKASCEIPRNKDAICFERPGGAEKNLLDVPGEGEADVKYHKCVAAAVLACGCG